MRQARHNPLKRRIWSWCVAPDSLNVKILTLCSCTTACAHRRVQLLRSSSRTRVAFEPSPWAANPSSGLCKALVVPKGRKISNGMMCKSGRRLCSCKHSSLSLIHLTPAYTTSLGSPEQQAQWNKTALGKTAFAEQLFKRSAYSSDGRPAGGINLRDNLRRNDHSKTPLEFIYEAADCRMFYTAPMINDVTMVWKGVADRMFRNSTSRCVQGSTGDPSSVTGGGQTKSGSLPPPPQGAELSNDAAPWRSAGLKGWMSVGVALVLALYL